MTTIFYIFCFLFMGFISMMSLFIAHLLIQIGNKTLSLLVELNSHFSKPYREQDGPEVVWSPDTDNPGGTPYQGSGGDYSGWLADDEDLFGPQPSDN